MPSGGVVVNRVHHDEAPDADPDELAAELTDELGPRLAERVAENLRDYQVLARRGEENIAHLAERLDDERRLALAPHLDDDVHDVAGRAPVQRYPFASRPERAPVRAAEPPARPRSSA